MALNFKEIEHKFIASSDFDRETFMESVRSLGPIRCDQVEVEDHYYVLANHREYIWRFRLDREIQQLTVKSVTNNTVERLEINLELDQSRGSQLAAVEAFLDCFGIKWKAKLSKDVAVAYFSDCEIVHYVATAGVHRIGCVEFEATASTSLSEGLQVLNTYEKKLGFDANKAETSSLFDLLLLKDAPEDVVRMFSNRRKI